MKLTTPQEHCPCMHTEFPEKRKAQKINYARSILPTDVRTEAMKVRGKILLRYNVLLHLYFKYT